MVFNSHDLGPSAAEHFTLILDGSEGTRSLPIPGVRCATCAARGEDVWVTPGLICAKCRTPASSDSLSTICYDGDENGHMQ
ncbi:hypothetical protein N657DRAFT_581607 [Parathielavia appendiculata]|uniref:Uncharacterized protein n=1 Tax=Parathielavia appendiculata TaxID=2587402 RepID=A0AAN6TRV0_9PEZI|nr:hypothetical protein N657DRAFT_581607 [Parathielavia appendiculata]